MLAINVSLMAKYASMASVAASQLMSWRECDSPNSPYTNSAAVIANRNWAVL